MKIKIYKGVETIVDKEDFEYLNQYKWLIDSKGYVVRHEPRKKGRVRGWIYMHRIVNKTPDNMETDHINRNKLDNRKCNLRTVTHQKNLFNLSLAKNNTSSCRGVTRKGDKWQAQIVFNKKCIYLGTYLRLEDAIFTRKESEKKYHAI